jgi:hypothetical protein
MMTGYRSHCLQLAVSLLVLVLSCQASSAGEHDLLFFVDVEAVHNNSTPDDGLEEYEVIPGADILYAYSNSRFRFLGEYFASTKETELERFQLGWQSGAASMAWIGRFHLPSSYWTSVFHHGRYLQTSITRPSLDEYEDDGGVLATHVSGLMIEAGHVVDDAQGFGLMFSLGAAEVFDDGELEPFDLLDPESGHKMRADLRLSYLPEDLGENQAGLLFGWADINAQDSPLAKHEGLTSIEQYRIGAYIDWRWQSWRVISTVISVINDMQQRNGSETDRFFAGYVQAEYKLGMDWTLFGRLEGTTNARSSSYLELFPHYITERQMLGSRYDFSTNQAIAVEISNAESLSDDFGQVWLQWSAVFP